MTNRSKTLYIGVTNRFQNDVSLNIGKGYVQNLTLHQYSSGHQARKAAKGWRRLKKIALIVALNPAWEDLSEEWYASQSRELHRSFDYAESFASE